MHAAPKSWRVAGAMFILLGLVFALSFLLAGAWWLLGIPAGLLGMGLTLWACAWSLSRGSRLGDIEILRNGSVFFWAGLMLLSASLQLGVEHEMFARAVIPSALSLALGALILLVYGIDRLTGGAIIQKERFLSTLALVIAASASLGVGGLLCAGVLLSLLR